MFLTYQGLKKNGVVEIWGGGAQWVVVAHGLQWLPSEYVSTQNIPNLIIAKTLIVREIPPKPRRQP